MQRKRTQKKTQSHSRGRGHRHNNRPRDMEREGEQAEYYREEGDRESVISASNVMSALRVCTVLQWWSRWRSRDTHPPLSQRRMILHGPLVHHLLGRVWVFLCLCISWYAFDVTTYPFLRHTLSNLEMGNCTGQCGCHTSRSGRSFVT